MPTGPYILIAISTMTVLPMVARLAVPMALPLWSVGTDSPPRLFTHPLLVSTYGLSRILFRMRQVARFSFCLACAAEITSFFLELLGQPCHSTHLSQ